MVEVQDKKTKEEHLLEHRFWLYQSVIWASMTIGIMSIIALAWGKIGIQTIAIILISIGFLYTMALLEANA